MSLAGNTGATEVATTPSSAEPKTETSVAVSETELVDNTAVATTEPTTDMTAEPIAVPTQEVVAACTVRCPKGCSFPGRCRRYTDQNSNGLCDLGECL
jgi:hypothetical protein